MTTANFDRCLEEVLRHEGGYADHPSDPGGATNMGITRKTLARWRGVSPWWELPKQEVKNLKRGEARAIYKGLYWDVIAGNELPDGLDLALFDYAVNSGPARAVMDLQRELKVRIDGAVGPITLGAARDAAHSGGIAGLIAALCARRLAFLKSLSIFAVFGRGWQRRVADVQASALQLAGAKAGAIPEKRRSLMNILSGYKTYIVGLLMLLAGIAQTLGVDLPGFADYSAGQLIMEGIGIVFLRKGLKNDISNA